MMQSEAVEEEIEFSQIEKLSYMWPSEKRGKSHLGPTGRREKSSRTSAEAHIAPRTGGCGGG